MIGMICTFYIMNGHISLKAVCIATDRDISYLACMHAKAFIMALIRVYKRNSNFVELANLVEEISNIGLTDTLKKYYNKPFEHEAKSIVAGPSFMQFLNKLFKTQIAAGDILQFESGNSSKYFMFSLTGTWDEIIKLQ
jgi:hypothetical protein